MANVIVYTFRTTLINYRKSEEKWDKISKCYHQEK